MVMAEDMTQAHQERIIVLGLGNRLRRDEGLGVCAAQRLYERYMLPDTVQVVDGGTLGLDLLCYLEDADQILILDAALTEGPPGTLLRLADEDVPSFFGIRASPHEVGLADLLAVTKLRGTTPRHVIVLGMQPEALELGWELSDSVAAHLETLVEAAADELRHMGVEVQERAADMKEATHA